MNAEFATDEHSSISCLRMTAMACSAAMRQAMEKAIRAAGAAAAVLSAGDKETGPSVILRDKASRTSVHRSRLQDCLNRALGRGGVAGLRAVRPTGFITTIQPEKSEPRCSVSLIPLEWGFEEAEQSVPMPFTIGPVAGKSFFGLLPAAASGVASGEAKSQSLRGEWIPCSPATQLIPEIGLMPAVDPPSQRVRSKRRSASSCA